MTFVSPSKDPAYSISGALSAKLLQWPHTDKHNSVKIFTASACVCSAMPGLSNVLINTGGIKYNIITITAYKFVTKLA